MGFLTKMTVALFVAAAVTAGVGYWYFSNQLTAAPLPPTALATEEALAIPESIGLFHIDVAHAIATDRALLGEEDREAMLGPLAQEPDIVAELHRRGFSLRDDLDQVLGSLVLTPEGLSGAMVFLGRFPAAELDEILTASYRAERQSVGDWDVLLTSYQDPETCELTPPVAVHITESRITVAAPELIGRVLERLANPGATRPLTAWRDYRAGKLFSAALFVPPMAAFEELEAPFARMILGVAEERAATVQSLYLGGEVEPVPPSLTLDVRVENSDPDWARKEAIVFETWREGLGTDYAERLPSIARLLDSVSVSDSDNAFSLRAKLDKAALRNFAQIPAEIVTAMFSGFGAEPVGEDPIGADQEQILPEENVAKYLSRASHRDLAAFDDEANQNFKADAQTGPFGVRVKALRLHSGEPDSNEGEIIEIELEATSGEIPNMGDPYAGVSGTDDARGQLFVTTVTDRSGKNLLREETCGKDRNDSGGALAANTQHIYVNEKFVQIPILQGTKSLRLGAGSKMEDLSGIEGFVRLRLPTETETRLVAAPFDGKVVETEQARIRFGDGGPNGVKYEVSGDPRAVLAVRALNAQKAYLAGAGSYSSGRLFGAGKSVGQSYQGQPVHVEVVLVTRETEADYPFSLSSPVPQFNVWDYPAAFEVQTQTAADFQANQGQIDSRGACEEAKSDDGLLPFALCMSSLRPSWGDSLHWQFIVAGPDTPSIAGNQSALEIELKSLEVDNKAEPVQIQHRQFVILSRAFGGEEPFIRENDYMLVEEVPGLEESQVLTASGNLIVRLPQELKRMALDVTNLGNAVAAEGGHGAVLTAIEDGSLKLALTGPRATFVQFVPKDREGKILPANNERIEAGEEPEEWVGSLRVSGVPSVLEIVYATKQAKLELPFTLKVQ